MVFEHPGRTGFWLIKRLTDDEGWVVSDNADDSVDDSRNLGHIPLENMMTVVTQLDEAHFAEACRLLIDEDDDIAALVQRWGTPEFWHRNPGFPTLVLLILEQQVSLESGAAMYRRLLRLVDEVTPERVVTVGQAALRSVGVTRQKATYLVELATLVVEGALDLEVVADMETSDARGALTSVRGIGAWTADAYLLSAERRPDMWPVGDRALQVGTGDMLGMAKTPDPSELEIIGEAWRPIRAVAARLIWHAYLSERGRVEPPDPTRTHGPPSSA